MPRCRCAQRYVRSVCPLRAGVATLICSIACKEVRGAACDARAPFRFAYALLPPPRLYALLQVRRRRRLRRLQQRHAAFSFRGAPLLFSSFIFCAAAIDADFRALLRCRFSLKDFRERLFLRALIFEIICYFLRMRDFSAKDLSRYMRAAASA